MRVLLLVNGSVGSAASIRAHSFAQRLPGGWVIRIEHRLSRKALATLQFLKSVALFRPAVVYVVDLAYSGVLAGRVAQAVVGSRVIVDTGDATYALAQSAGGYTLRQLRLIEWVENLAHRTSDALVVRGSYHAELLQSEGCPKVVFIPDGVDGEQFTPGRNEELRETLGLGDSLVVGMIGSMNWSDRYSMCYGWDIVEALPHLSDLPVKALLVGGGSGRRRLEERAVKLGVTEKIAFAGSVPYEQLPRYLQAMDVCVSTQSNDVVGMVRTTGKLPLYLAAGKRVVATQVGEARRVLPGIGYLLPYEGVRDDAHPARLAAQIRAIASTPGVSDEEIRAVGLSHFSYELLSRSVREVCEWTRDRKAGSPAVATQSPVN